MDAASSRQPSLAGLTDASASADELQFGEYETWTLKQFRITENMRRNTHSVLFRVISDQSQGRNDTGFYQARDVVSGVGHANFYKYPKSQIREMLRDHVRSYKRPGHLISFTASFATAIEFALRRKEKWRKEHSNPHR